MQEPHKNSYLKWDFYLPNIFSKKPCMIIHMIQIKGFNQKIPGVVIFQTKAYG
jgi:hypothetical protein